MFIEIPNYLKQEDIKFISDTFKKYTTNDPKLQMYNRMGKSVGFDDIKTYNTPDVQELDSRMFPIFYGIVKNVVIPNFEPEFEVEDSGVEYHWYKPGDICNPHIDGAAPIKDKNNSVLRFATIILHLTTNTDGGEIVFPKQDKKFKTEAGKLLVFPPHSYYPHYTTPSNQDREILMTWMVYRGLTVIK